MKLKIRGIIHNKDKSNTKLMVLNLVYHFQQSVLIKQ